MNFYANRAIIVLVSLALAGCSSASSFLNSKSSVPQATNIPVGNSLAMPPDLQLAAPTQTSDAYEPNGAVAPVASAANIKTPTTKPIKQMASASTVAPIAPKPDLYEQYGISKTNADGTPKDRAVLQAELKAAMLKKKRETNPGYGTITNIGAIFKDQ